MNHDVFGLSNLQREHPAHLRRMLHDDEKIVIALARVNVLHNQHISSLTSTRGQALQAISDSWKRNLMHLRTRIDVTGEPIALPILNIKIFRSSTTLSISLLRTASRIARSYVSARRRCCKSRSSTFGF